MKNEIMHILKKKSLYTKVDSSVLAMYSTRKQYTLQRFVMPSDPEVLQRIVGLVLACIVVISSFSFDTYSLALMVTV